MLKNYKVKFLSHKKACRKLIELKQKSLPRLSFLSDQESLILLGGLSGGDGDIFQKVVRKILGQSFKSLAFETNKEDGTTDGASAGGSMMTVSQVESMNGERYIFFFSLSFTFFQSKVSIFIFYECIEA